MLTATYRFNKRIATATIRFIVTVAIVVYKGSIPVVYRMLTLRHILVGVFPPFWLPNLICGGIPKDTKKPTNSQYFVYELVG